MALKRIFLGIILLPVLFFLGAQERYNSYRNLFFYQISPRLPLALFVWMGIFDFAMLQSRGYLYYLIKRPCEAHFCAMDQSVAS